jgi:predicted ferric reductase
MGVGAAFGWLGLAAVLASSSLYAVNRVAPGLSMRYMKVHCYAGFASVVFTLLHAAYNLESLAGDWNGLTNLGLVLVIAGSGMLLRHVPEAGSYRFHSATVHRALVLALLVSVVLHVIG